MKQIVKIQKNILHILVSDQLMFDLIESDSLFMEVLNN